MSKLSRFVLALAIAAGANGMLANSSFRFTQDSEAARLATDGAFRDGLYLGKLAARNAGPLRPAIGRWSTEQDRSMFTAGYERGYHDVLAGIAP